MGIYARIDGSAVAELFETDGNIAEMFTPDLVWVDVTSVTPAPEVGWSATEAGSSWTFAAPGGPTPAEAQAALIAEAHAALDASDLTIIRCYEHAVAVPTEWQTYRAALRAIVSGASSATSLPERPAFPAGT